ncbi:MAG: Flp pilus assembly complex ATPase component TadA [Chloroflexi bacterium]|nr:Flp pilus assembly complex ATPase component TadA [Chloroflexota bacterium]
MLTRDDYLWQQDAARAAQQPLAGPFPAAPANSLVAQAVADQMDQAARKQDPLQTIFAEVNARLRTEHRLAGVDLTQASQDVRDLVEEKVVECVKDYIRRAEAGRVPPLAIATTEAVQAILDQFFGMGILQTLLDDPDIEEIIVRGLYPIITMGARGFEVSALRFRTAEEALGLVRRAASRMGRDITPQNPEVNVRTRDGSRLHALMTPLTFNVPFVITIRRRRLVATTIDDLLELGTITRPAAEFLRAAVTARLNILVAGGTGAGKTNLVNVLASFFGPQEYVLTIEDNPELALPQEYVTSLVVRERSEGVLPITTQDLVRAALRMRPDRIIIGEARGPEVVDMIDAANTGHEGTLSTIHADNAEDVLARIRALYTRAGLNVPQETIVQETVRAFQLVVLIRRVSPQSTRREVAQIMEWTGRMEATKPERNILFENTGGGLHWTGSPAECGPRLQQYGFSFQEIARM